MLGRQSSSVAAWAISFHWAYQVCSAFCHGAQAQNGAQQLATGEVARKSAQPPGPSKNMANMEGDEERADGDHCLSRILATSLHLNADGMPEGCFGHDPRSKPPRRASLPRLGIGVAYHEDIQAFRDVRDYTESCRLG